MGKERTETLKVNISKDIAGFSLDAGWSADGGITCLFGYTGSGKSLTLKMIAGLMMPDSGSISFDGKTFFNSSEGVNVSPQDRDIGYVFQNNMLFPHMTVYENILYGLSNKENGKRERVQEILKITRLSSLEDKYPHQISGGQQQRTAIARAIIKRPKLLLLDEPFNSLDHAVRKKMYKDLIFYQRFFSVPIILVTHDMDELYSLADRVVLYNDGKVVQSGAVEEVFKAPSGRTAARLVGTKNIFDGEVISAGDENIKVKTERVTLTVSKKDGLSAGDKVAMAIRPESFLLVNPIITNGQDGENTFKCTVLNYIKNSRSYDLFLSTGDDEYDFEVNVSADEFSRLDLKKGKEITVKVDIDKINLISG
jgi:molybdate transport system ATP-binding protein